MPPSGKERSSKTGPPSRRRNGTKNAPSTARGRGNGRTRARVRLDVDERRLQLVELGLTHFGARPYDEVSVDLIAQAAGISKGLLYHYFPTKRAFYLACVSESARRLLARMDLPIDVPPFERLRLGLERYLEYVRGHGRAYATLMRSGAHADRKLASIIEQTRATLLSQLTSDLAEILPNVASPSSTKPLVQIALQGWIGLAEVASIAWVEACVEAECDASKIAPTAVEVRDMLVQALFSILDIRAIDPT